MRARFVPLVATAVLVAAASASAATIRVPKDQATIQAAATAANPGDTIKVSRGVYPGGATLAVPNVRLVGVGVVIDGNVAGVDGNCITILADGVVVQGITFRNGTDQVDVTGNSVSFVRCAFVDSQGDAVLATGTDLLVSKCSFTGVSGLAVNSTGDRARMEKCVLRHCGNGGVDFTGNDASVESSQFLWVDDTESVTVNGDRAFLQRNAFSRCDRDGIRVNGNDALVQSNRGDRLDSRLVNVQGDNAVVQGNSTTWTRGAVTVVGNNSQVLSTKVKDCGSGDAISVDGDGVTVSSNVILSTWDDADGIAVTSATPAGGGLVESNRVTDAAGSAVVLNNANGVTVRGNVSTRSTDDGRAAFSVTGDANVLEDNAASGPDSTGFLLDGNNNSATRCTAKSAMADGFQVLGAGNAVTDCVASKCGGEGFDNRGTGTTLLGGTYTRNRIDLANDVIGGATFSASTNLATVTFGSGGATTQPEVD